MAYLSLVEKIRIPDYFSRKHTTTGKVLFDESLCSGCGICASICPARAIKITEIENIKTAEMRRIFKDDEIMACLACGDCVAACPKDAIKIYSGYSNRYFFKNISQTGDFAWPKKY